MREQDFTFAAEAAQEATSNGGDLYWQIAEDQIISEAEDAFEAEYGYHVEIKSYQQDGQGTIYDLHLDGPEDLLEDTELLCGIRDFYADQLKKRIWYAMVAEPSDLSYSAFN